MNYLIQNHCLTYYFAALTCDEAYDRRVDELTKEVKEQRTKFETLNSELSTNKSSLGEKQQELHKHQENREK